MQRTTLLIIDGSINLALGVLLLAFPASLVDFLGVPGAASPFYPNILGGVLFGIAIALFIEARKANGPAAGLGLTGAVIINLCGGLVLGAWLLAGRLDLPVRGQVILWTLVAVLVGISILELATALYKSRHSA